MIRINTLTLGAYQTNCHIVRDAAAKSCAVIDPGYDPQTILAFLHKEGISLDAILLTHGHFDHVGAVEALVKATGCQVWIHQRDDSQPKNPTNLYFYPLAGRTGFEVRFCQEGDAILAGGLTFHVLETPGHTWGSVCYRCEDALFCGDTLFSGSCGRIDLPGGDRAAMLKSLRRLSEMPTDFRVFPGHGGSSTLFREQQTNPYLGGYL